MYVHVTGISFVIYALIGFFGASDFGSNTSGNILENDLGAGAGQGVLNIAMSRELPPKHYCQLLCLNMIVLLFSSLVLCQDSSGI